MARRRQHPRTAASWHDLAVWERNALDHGSASRIEALFGSLDAARAVWQSVGEERKRERARRSFRHGRTPRPTSAEWLFELGESLPEGPPPSYGGLRAP